MTDTSADATFDLKAYATAAAGFLGFSIDAAWLPAIIANLEVLHAAAARVSEFPLPDEAEAAPIYEA